MSNSDKCCRCGGPIEEHPDERYQIPLALPRQGRIVIHKTPAGEAPLEVREGWVGLSIPTVCFESRTNDALSVVTRSPIPQQACYLVDQDVAIAKLIKHCPSAAVWWVMHGFPEKDGHFAFLPDEVQEVEPVSPRF
jgi:hypothetical protein